MIFDTYLHYAKDLTKKHKYIQDAILGSYEPLQKQSKRAGEVVLYLTPVPDAVHAHSQRRPALSLSVAGGQYLSGLYIPDMNNSALAFGDTGNDALFVFLGDNQLEVLISRNKKPVSFQIYSALLDNDSDLTAELEDFRQKTKKGGGKK